MTTTTFPAEGLRAQVLRGRPWRHHRLALTDAGAAVIDAELAGLVEGARRTPASGE